MGLEGVRRPCLNVPRNGSSASVICKMPCAAAQALEAWISMTRHCSLAHKHAPAGSPAVEKPHVWNHSPCGQLKPPKAPGSLSVSQPQNTLKG